MRRPAPISTAPPNRSEARDTLRGAVVMVAAMGCFAVEDALIKAMGGALAQPLPVAQIIWMLGVGGAVCLVGVLVARGEPLIGPDLRHPVILWRTGAEVVATLCFVPALVLIPLATATAILQAAPLVVAGGAALFLGATVGWRRWAAIGVGFVGVLLIVRPGAAFEPATLLAVAGTLALGARDVLTRRVPPGVSNLRVSLVAYAALIPTAMALQAAMGAPLTGLSGAGAALLATSVAIGLLGYVGVVGAMRLGEVAVVSTFRYARMVFALILALTVFGERPDALALTGIAVIVGAGVYTLGREARLARAGRSG